MINLGDILRQVANRCQMCEQDPFAFVVELTFKPEHRIKHGPDCDCHVKPLRGYLCEGCKDKAVECANGQCEDGEGCEVESVRVQTETEAANEQLLPQAISLGVSTGLLRFSMAYRLDVREAQTVLDALEAFGVPVDFGPIRPVIGSPTEGRSDTSSSPESAGMAADSVQSAEDSGGSKPTRWPVPIVALPNDGNVH